MRKKLDIQPPAFDAQTTPHIDKNIVTQEREYRLITPLFGGGALPGKYDPVTIIRGTEIRGQLRFWWRACRGGQFTTVQELKEAEDKIWGKAHKKGDTAPSGNAAQIVIEIVEEGKPVVPFTTPTSKKTGKKYAAPANEIPGYVSFPLQPDQTELSKEKPFVQPVQSEIVFKLIISFYEPKEKDGKDTNDKSVSHRKDIAAALWAWETFGGLGARTRRGFGALHCIKITEREKSIDPDLPPATLAGAIEWLQQRCQDYVAHDASWPKHMTHLMPHPVQGEHFEIINRASPSNPLAVWNDLIERLSWFRQMRTHPEVKFDPGRSIWPEPDAIRRALKQHIQKHEKPIMNPPVYKFPRAAFGLPLPFKFKDDDTRRPDNPERDPRKSVLQPKDHERLSSPLLLKPLACQNNMTLGLAFILAGIDVRQIQLELRPQDGRKGKEDIRKAEALLGEKESFVLKDHRVELEAGFEQTVNRQSNILQIFLKYLVIPRKRGK